MNSLAEMLRMAGSSDDDRNDTCYRPDPMAQAMELRERFTRLNNVATFAPGDLVRSKFNVGSIKPEMRLVLIVSRILVPGNAYDDLLLAKYVKDQPIERCGIRPDMICLDLMTSVGKMLTADLFAFSQMEHVTDADLAAWTLPK
jgi:hypothetical protein